MQGPLATAACLAFFALGCATGGSGAPDRGASADAAVQPEGLPEIFAPETISVGNVWKGSFAPDGRSFYFFKKLPGKGENYRIHVSRLQGERWTAPEPLTLGGDFSELYPVVSPDGRRLVFVSYRPAPGEAAGAKPQATLWFAPSTGDGWGEPVYMAKVNLPGWYHSQPAFDGQGALYFRRSQGNGPNTTYVTRWDGETYGAPEIFPPIDRWTSGWRDGLFVWGGVPSPDGSFIVLEVSHVDPAGKRGPADLWVTRRQGDDWTEPRPLGAGINTPGMENFIFFSSDGKDLFFVRDFERFYRIPVAAALG